jgi:hypothetical protein
MVQPVFFMNEFFTTTTALDNGSVMYTPCMTDKVGIIFEFLLAVLTNVLVATKQFQFHYLLTLTIKDF